jgi:hypothetical protein
MVREPILKFDCHLSRIDSKSTAQGLKRALFRAPEEGKYPPAITRRRLCNECLFLRGEEIRNKSIAVRLDCFEIATEQTVGSDHSAHSDAGSMAERDSERDRVTGDPNFRRAAWQREYFDLLQVSPRAGRLEATQKRLFCSPSSEQPVRPAAGKA